MTNTERDSLIKPLGQTNLERCVAMIKNHTFKLLKQSLVEYYEAPLGSLLFNERQTRALSPTNPRPKEDAVMKVEYDADICSQIQGAHGSNPYLSARAVILRAHKALNIKPTRTFEGITADIDDDKRFSEIRALMDEDDNPFWKMRSLRRDREGRPLPSLYGVTGPRYAARAAVGDITIVEPIHSVEIPDEEARQLIREAFTLDRLAV